MGARLVCVWMLCWQACLGGASAGDIAPLHAPENDLAASILSRSMNGGLRLAPLTGRVWSYDQLRDVVSQDAGAAGDALRRLLGGGAQPRASALSGLALLSAEEQPRLAYRLSGLHSFGDRVDAMFVVDTTRSLYEQRPLLPWLHTAQLRLYTSWGEWRIGQAPVRWGGGYSGALLLSDHAPPMTHLSYRHRWHLGRRFGTWQFEQMAALFEEEGSRRYVMARRLSRDLSPRWHLSFAEAFKATKLPAGVAAPVLPFYFYQHRATWSYYNGRDEWFNYLAEVQLKYRWRGQTAYLNLLLDDIQAPRWLTRFRHQTPRKSGVLLGYHTPLARGGQLLVEIAHTDGDPGGGTYSFKIPENRWRYRDAVLGHPVGTNRDMLYARLDLPVAQQGYLAVEYVNTRMANASPEAHTGIAWNVHLCWMVGGEGTVGVRWQHDTTRDGEPSRWLVYVGKMF
ncbi:MAG: hypothetical protein NZ741_08055 [Armatimonadetes bacterium]|nr:hypothetical protein [Armatimonadota bacterium]